MKSKLTTLAALALLSGVTAQAQNLLTNGSFGDDPADIAVGNNPGGLLYNNFGYNRNSAINGWNIVEPANTFNVALTSGVADASSGGVFGAGGSPVTGYDVDNRGAWVNQGGSINQITTTNIADGTTYELDLTWAYTGTNGPATFTFQIIDDLSNVLAQDTIVTSTQDLTLDAITTLSYTGQASDAGRTIGVNLISSGGNNVFVVDAVSLTAVPEPSAFALIGGALALGFVATRRRR